MAPGRARLVSSTPEVRKLDDITDVALKTKVARLHDLVPTKSLNWLYRTLISNGGHYSNALEACFPQSSSDRGSSPELGDPSSLPTYNPKTGRPMRHSAVRKKTFAGYVDSAVIEEDDPINLPSEDEDGNPVRPKRPNNKRKRTPSPTPPPLDPIIYNEDADPPTDEESTGAFHHNTEKQSPVELTFNVPLGFHGPLVVKLDKALMANGDGAARDLQPKKAKRSIAASPGPSRNHAFGPHKTGFLDLPAELRNRVYRMLFVAHSPMRFNHPHNFCRSAAFLRSCKVVASEGCSILYGENTFIFERNRSTRSPFWDPVPKEIGYKDVRLFLKMIGPENLVYLRHIRFDFEDANPGVTPYLKTVEHRRYINDEHLIDCLRILRGAKLRKLELMFAGRRTLARTDVKFLGYLEQIRADEVVNMKEFNSWNPNKIWEWTWRDLQNTMTREKKLFV